MNLLTKQPNRWLVLGAAALLATSARATELNARELDASIQAGDFTAFSTAISESLAKKMPADPKQISEATIQTLITDPTFVGGLSQRQFVAKAGVVRVVWCALTLTIPRSLNITDPDGAI